jgi:NADH-quinone oxidoreductase subunit M
MSWESSALTITVFLPLVGAAIIALIPKEREESARPIALIVSVIGFALSLLILASYDFGARGLQFEADTS